MISNLKIFDGNLRLTTYVLEITINADIAKKDVSRVANNLMDNFGWKMGASLKLLTEGAE